MGKPTDDVERCTLATKIYDLVLHNTESFEIDHIGSDLAYLMGAILKDGFCMWGAERPLIKLLTKSRSRVAKQALAFIVFDSVTS